MNNQIPARARWDREQTYDERFPRYTANAKRESLLAEDAAARWERSANYYARAGRNARQKADTVAADLYAEMAENAREAAEALRDVASASRDVAEHYGKRPE